MGVSVVVVVVVPSVSNEDDAPVQLIRAGEAARLTIVDGCRV